MSFLVTKLQTVILHQFKHAKELADLRLQCIIKTVLLSTLKMLELMDKKILSFLFILTHGQLKKTFNSI